MPQELERGRSLMISAEDLLSIPIFAQLEITDREHFATRAADVRLPAHEWLIHEGEPSSFYALLEGRVEMWKDLNGKQELLLTRGPNEFFGEMPLLLGSPSLVSIRAIERCRLARFDRQQLQELIRDYPGFGSAIFATLNERFLRTQDWARATPIARVILRGQHAHPLWPALRSFLFANHVPYTFLPEAPGTSISNDPSQIAIEVDGSALSAPFTLTGVAKALHMQVEPGAKLYDLVVVGAGPAGMASAVYAASEGLKTLVIERAAAGGQAGTSSRIENYLGFPGGVSGDELSGRALKQAQRFGAEVMVTRSVTSLCKEGNLFHTVIEGGTRFTANASCSPPVSIGESWMLPACLHCWAEGSSTELPERKQSPSQGGRSTWWVVATRQDRRLCFSPPTPPRSVYSCAAPVSPAACPTTSSTNWKHEVTSSSKHRRSCTRLLGKVSSKKSNSPNLERG